MSAEPTLRSAVTGLLACAGAVLLAACGNGPMAPEPLTELPRSLTAAEARAIGASNDFAFRLLTEVRADLEPAENVFFSPLSVSMVLGMAANGAAGETLDGMKDALGTTHLTREEMNDAYRGLLDLLPGLDERVEVGVANSAWARQGVPFRDAFVQRVGQSFDAEVRELDFTDPTASDVINGWVSDRTRGRIDEIVEEIRPEHILFLINASYFKGTWTTEFDPSDSRDGQFHLEDGTVATVPMMRHEELPGSYHFTGEVAVGELPYGNTAYVMTVVVPVGGTLTELLGSLTAERWQSWMTGLSEDEVPVRLPRFEMEFKASLVKPLSRMGMGVAFTDAADFGEMTDLPALLSDVKHKTFLMVDEEGTEAAAVTSGEVAVTSAPRGLYADRPFLVAIRERLSGTILFLGAVYDPR